MVTYCIFSLFIFFFGVGMGSLDGLDRFSLWRVIVWHFLVRNCQVSSIVFIMFCFLVGVSTLTCRCIKQWAVFGVFLLILVPFGRGC